MLTQLSSTLDRSKAICNDIDASLAAIEENLGSTYTDLKALQNSASYKELTTLLKMNPDDVSSFMSSPVKLDTITIYPVNPYGSGVAPFFSNLALWVCGFILMAIVRIRVDPTGLPKFTPTQGYFGRWMFYISVGLVQSIVICAGDLIIGVKCVNPAAFFGAGILAGFVYVNLLYALAVCMRHIGKALAVVLLVMQIPGSSGMFPIEMMPKLYQVINPLLPFTYSIDAMREAIGGIYGNHYLMDMLALGLGFIPIGFAIGLIGGQREIPHTGAHRVGGAHRASCFDATHTRAVQRLPQRKADTAQLVHSRHSSCRRVSGDHLVHKRGYQLSVRIGEKPHESRFKDGCVRGRKKRVRCWQDQR